MEGIGWFGVGALFFLVAAALFAIPLSGLAEWWRGRKLQPRQPQHERD